LRKRPYPANTGLKFRDQVISIYGQKCRIIHSGDWEWRWGPRVSALIRRGLTENRERD
jgi:hypothetical protein